MNQYYVDRLLCCHQVANKYQERLKKMYTVPNMSHKSDEFSLLVGKLDQLYCTTVLLLL